MYNNTLHTKIQKITQSVRKSSLMLRTLSPIQRNKALKNVSKMLVFHKQTIFNASKKDVQAAKSANLNSALIERLIFNEKKLREVCTMIDAIITLEDNLYKPILKRILAEGLTLVQRKVPIGVIAMIFESRPDALVQIACLCLKSANGLILKGGSEAQHTNKILFKIINEASQHIICGVNNKKTNLQWIHAFTTREEIHTLITLPQCVDLIIPRGSAHFVKYIMKKSTVPVLGHAEGICHAYVHRDVDVPLCQNVIFDSKMQYPAVCNALECLVIHKDALSFLPQIITPLIDVLVTFYADKAAGAILQKNNINFKNATDNTWGYEYLDTQLSIRTVKDESEAINFINTYGSGHTDLILTNNKNIAHNFELLVDSSSVLWNCSTRFSDGYKYGLGAELGVSTSHIHARGPVGIEGLLSTQWVLESSAKSKKKHIGHTVAPFMNGTQKFIHKDVSL